MKRIFFLTLLTIICFCACNSNDPEFNESMDIPKICNKLTHKKLFDIIKELKYNGYTKIKLYSNGQWEELEDITEEEVSQDRYYYKLMITNLDESTQWEIHYGDPSGNNTDDICKSFIVYKYLSSSDRNDAYKITKYWSEYMYKNYKKCSNYISFSVTYGETINNLKTEKYTWLENNEKFSSPKENSILFDNAISNHINDGLCQWGISYMDEKEYTIIFSMSWNESERKYLTYYYTNYQIEVPM